MKNIRSIRKCITKAAAGIAAGLLCCQSITAFAAGSVVTTDHVRIRKGPSLNAEIITVLNPGTELPLISQPDAEWDEVQFNGSSAYIARQFVSERATASDTAAQSSEAAQSTPAQAAAQAAQP
ncbi:MAG: SH3 domain-containing protein, partial [Lachnospiraceae bacterium]|nr:SH3 domain-containing protein [Lachnospiraceae bacterium]